MKDLKFALLLLLALSLQLACAAQNNLKTETMSHIDPTKTYLEIKEQYNLPDGRFYDLYLSDSTNIRVSTFSDGTLQLNEELTNGYGYIYIYRIKNNFKTSAYGREFYDQNIGIWRVYDENGNLKREDNEDQYYAFSMEQVIDKMKKEYNVDLHDRSRVYSVWRTLDNQYLHKPIYKIDYFLTPIQKQQCCDDFLVNGYLIDGTTGETIFVHQYDRWDEYGYDAYDAYLIELGLKSKDDFGPQDLSKLPPPPGM